MQKDNRLYQLAENVLKNSVKLKKGEKIYIEAFGPAVLDLMEIFIQKATELGGVPFYFYNDEHLLKAVIDNASEEQCAPWETGMELPLPNRMSRLSLKLLSRVWRPLPRTGVK